MSKYSRIRKVGKKKFRYNYTDNLLEFVEKPDKQMLDDNKEWRAKYGRDLWEIRDGYCIIDEIGLSEHGWKADGEFWCEQWASELEEEASILSKDFATY